MRRTLVGALAIVCVFGATRVVHADSEEDAKDLFEKGRALREGGHCDQAIPLFAKAYKLYPNGLGSVLNLAECEEKQAMWASAHRDFLELKRALLTNPDTGKKYVGWDADAEAGAARTAPKVAKLTIHVVDTAGGGETELLGAKAKRIVVKINGEAIDPRLVGTELDRDPGSYAIDVEGGKAPAHGSIVLAASDSKSLKLSVELAPEPVATPTVTETRSNSKTARAIGWGAITVGGIGVAGTIVSIVVRQSALSKVKNECGSDYTSHPCPSDLSSTVDRGKTASILVDVFGGLAIAGLGVGVVLLATNPSTSETTSVPAPTTSIRLSPWAGATGGGATIFGSF